MLFYLFCDGCLLHKYYYFLVLSYKGPISKQIILVQIYYGFRKNNNSAYLTFLVYTQVNNK